MVFNTFMHHLCIDHMDTFIVTSFLQMSTPRSQQHPQESSFQFWKLPSCDLYLLFYTYFPEEFKPVASDWPVALFQTNYK